MYPNASWFVVETDYIKNFTNKELIDTKIQVNIENDFYFGEERITEKALIKIEEEINNRSCTYYNIPVTKVQINNIRKRKNY